MPVPVPVPLVDEISRVTITHAIGPRAAGLQGWQRGQCGQRCFPAPGQTYPGLSRLIQAYRYSIALSQSVLACLDQSSALRTVLPCCAAAAAAAAAAAMLYFLFIVYFYILPFPSLPSYGNAPGAQRAKEKRTRMAGHSQ